MPVDYNPKDATVCLQAGEYDATLEKVEDKTSQKTGNPMQVWTWRAYAPDGRDILVTDYVVIPTGTFKIKQLAKALGREEDFKAGQFQADDYIGAGVKLELTIEQQEGYDDKNRVGKIKPAGQPSTIDPPPQPAPQQTRPAAPPTTQQRAAHRPAPANPIGAGKQFTDDSIPF